MINWLAWVVDQGSPYEYLSPKTPSHEQLLFYVIVWFGTIFYFQKTKIMFYMGCSLVWFLIVLDPIGIIHWNGKIDNKLCEVLLFVHGWNMRINVCMCDVKFVNVMCIIFGLYDHWML